MDFIKTFPCAGCGARLTYSPGTRSLRCEFCGTANAIAENDARVEEQDFAQWLESLESRQETIEDEAVRCERCGAEQELPPHHFAAHCAFCAAPIVSKSYAKRHVKPQSLVPFQVDRRRAQDAFRQWVRGLWLAPAELKRYAQGDEALKGIYLPFWTYDCRTASDYQGERGEDYTTTEPVTSRDASGKTVTRMQQVVRTNWSPAAGHVERFHDDVLVMASHSLPHGVRGAARGWDLKALVPYQAQFLGGYLAEAYQVGLKEGFPIAKETIDVQVHEAVRRDIGGDRQRVARVATRYDEVKFKHVLLPVWVSAYRFRDKVYRFVVNGQTGEVAGESPISWQKTTLIVIGVIIWIVFLAWFFS